MVSPSRFEQMVLAHRNDAYNLAYWILQSPDDAEDAVQDAYVRAFRAFDTFAGDDPRPWLLARLGRIPIPTLSSACRAPHPAAFLLR